jgi:hypothetical protein
MFEEYAISHVISSRSSSPIFPALVSKNCQRRKASASGGEWRLRTPAFIGKKALVAGCEDFLAERDAECSPIFLERLALIFSFI